MSEVRYYPPRAPKKRGKEIKLTVYNPFRQPFQLLALVFTVVLVGNGTLPWYALMLVLAAMIKLTWRDG